MTTHKQLLRYRTFASSKHGVSSPVLVFVLAAIIVISFGATLSFLQRPSEGSIQTSSKSSGLASGSSSGRTASSSINAISSSLTHSSHSTQTYPSYSPPKSDIILLPPCEWGCNSNKFDWIILNDSALFGAPDPMIIKAQIALESGFHPDATSKLANSVCGGSTDYGLMQINPNCNNVNRSELFNATYNLYWGIRFWANDFLYLQQKWGSSCNTSMLIAGVLELYNGGANYIGITCGSFPNGTVYIGKISPIYNQFCRDANYTAITQLPNDTITSV